MKRVLLALMIVASLAAPAWAEWEYGGGIGTGFMAVTGATSPRTIVDDASDHYDIGLKLASQSTPSIAYARLASPVLFTFGGWGMRALCETTSTTSTSEQSGATTSWHLGAVVRRDLSPATSLEIGAGYNSASVTGILASVVSAPRAYGLPSDPGIELGGQVLPVGSAVQGTATATGYQFSVALVHRFQPSFLGYLRAQQGVTLTSGSWGYKWTNPIGTQMEPVAAYQQMSPLRLDGLAFQAGLTVEI